MKPYLAALIGILLSLAGHGAEVDTVETFSASMNKAIKAVIIKPDGYAQKGALPVIYLLHGYSGNYSNWVLNAPEIQSFADQHDILFVCADGGFGSWYWDSPVDSSSQYETYIVKELVAWVDTHYHTIADRTGRAITGFSMGGHGALYLAFRNQDVFGAAGSTAGGVDIRPFPLHWDLKSLLGDYACHPAVWEEHTVISLVHLLTPNSLSLIFDCGRDDFFYDVNDALHRKLVERNIPHTYITGPGNHDWDYWRTATSHQLLHFNKWFKKAK